MSEETEAVVAVAEPPVEAVPEPLAALEPEPSAIAELEVAKSRIAELEAQVLKLQKLATQYRADLQMWVTSHGNEYAARRLRELATEV